MKKDKVAELKKEIRTYYLKKCFSILASIVLVSVWTFLPLLCWYSVLRTGYISEKTNTLYSVTGKCTDVSYFDMGIITRSDPYYTFYIDDVKYRIGIKDISDYPDSDTLENVLSNSEVIVQYVTGVFGKNYVQSLQLSDGTVFADFEHVKKENTTNFIFACIMLPLFLLMVLPLLCWGCYGWISTINHKIENRIPVIKRRLNRMAEREKTFSEQDTE